MRLNSPGVVSSLKQYDVIRIGLVVLDREYQAREQTIEVERVMLEFEMSPRLRHTGGQKYNRAKTTVRHRNLALIP